jgi:hypothetical protein
MKKKKRPKFAFYIPEMDVIMIYSHKVTKYTCIMIAGGDWFFRENFVFLGEV